MLISYEVFPFLERVNELNVLVMVIIITMPNKFSDVCIIEEELRTAKMECCEYPVCAPHIRSQRPSCTIEGRTTLNVKMGKYREPVSLHMSTLSCLLRNQAVLRA